MSDNEEKVTQFTSITGATTDRANFYLDSAAWQLEVAIARYYENDGAEDSDNVEEVTQAVAPPKSPISVKKSKPKSKVKTSKSSNFATLNSITSSSEEEEEGQAYYAGGSEHSGQQVLGPPKKRDFVADMFKSVQEHGVEILEPSASSSNSRSFRGTGYKLGQDDNDTVVVPAVPDPPRPAEVTLRLWQNGFSLNDGDLRPYTDPSNREFLESIRQGEIPQELRQGATEVHLAMEDHRMESFRPMKNKKKAFAGHGYTLGSPAPAIVGTIGEKDKPNNDAKAKEQIKLDNSKPVTSLQIRLADGSRIQGQFNHQHTIAEIRNFIQHARPQYQNQAFNLLSAYPAKVLDDAQTIEAAGLLNAIVMQKLV